MNVRESLQAAAVCLALLALPLAAPALPPSSDKPAAPRSRRMEPPASGPMMHAPKLTPEHQRLAKVVGKWKARVKMYAAPGQPPLESDGVEENRSICDGLWIDTTFKGGPKMPFEGHGITGYDPFKKKYVGVWVDSWTASLARLEAVADPSGKVISSTLEAPDSTGALRTVAAREEWKDDNTRLWQLFPGPRPEGQPRMEILYTRQTRHGKAAAKKG